MMGLAVAVVATYYVAVTATRLHGPLGLAERARAGVYVARGFRPIDGAWARLGPSSTVQTIDGDWVAAGVSCPVCASLYVAPVMLALHEWGGAAGAAIVTVLAVAGASAFLATVAGGE